MPIARVERRPAVLPRLLYREVLCSVRDAHQLARKPRRPINFDLRLAAFPEDRRFINQRWWGLHASPLE